MVEEDERPQTCRFGVSGESRLLRQSKPECKRLLQVSLVGILMIKPTSEFNASSAYLFRTPDLGYNFDSNSGRAFNYFSYGVACSEVEIDCLTGAHKVRRGATLKVTAGRLEWF